MKKLFVAIIVLFLASPVQAAVIFSDTFEYQVDRDGDPSADVFATTGGWGWAKAINGGDEGACGYAYTVTSIPGFTGTFPGTNSSRVAVIESLPATLNCDQGGGWLQADTHLSVGSVVDGYLPGDLWIQFWVYINYYGTQLSQIHNGKWLYLCNNENLYFTCTGTDWDAVVMFAYESYQPNRTNQSGSLYGDPLPGSLYPHVQMRNGLFNDGDGDPLALIGENQGATNSSKVAANTWTLVKININVTNSNAPIFRMWMRKQNESEFTKVMDYIGGTTQYLSWTTANPNGWQWLSINESVDGYDSWIYYDDYYIASSESDLPTYGSSTRRLNNVTGVRVTLH